MTATGRCCKPAIEESLRLNPTDPMFSRWVTEDVDFFGVHVPKGAVMHLCIGAANRDPERWERPDEWDMDRPPKASLAFGGGPHICLGMHVARAEMLTGINALFDRLPDLRLDPQAEPPRLVGFYERARRHTGRLRCGRRRARVTVQDVTVSQTQRLAQLAQERPDEPAYRHVRLDGSEEVVTYAGSIAARVSSPRRWPSAASDTATGSASGCVTHRSSRSPLRRLEARRRAGAGALGRSGLGAAAPSRGDRAAGLPQS